MSEQRTPDELMQIRQLPAVGDRVETGPVAFGDDWPGVFIRGDNALIGYAPALSRVLGDLEQPDLRSAAGKAFDLMEMRSLLELLRSCALVKP